jgi:hypothetical protein
VPPGYDGRLYILEREQTATIADAKRLIFEGMLEAVSRGAEPGTEDGVGRLISPAARPSGGARGW